MHIDMPRFSFIANAISYLESLTNRKTLKEALRDLDFNAINTAMNNCSEQIIINEFYKVVNMGYWQSNYNSYLILLDKYGDVFAKFTDKQWNSIIGCQNLDGTKTVIKYFKKTMKDSELKKMDMTKAFFAQQEEIIDVPDAHAIARGKLIYDTFYVDPEELKEFVYKCITAYWEPTEPREQNAFVGAYRLFDKKLVDSMMKRQFNLDYELKIKDELDKLLTE
jgi:hypothetical protein